MNIPADMEDDYDEELAHVRATNARDEANERVAPEQLYMDGNGRLSCAALRCAGMTANFSGMKRDINGAKISRLTPEQAVELSKMIGEWPTCECCGAPAPRLA